MMIEVGTIIAVNLMLCGSIMVAVFRMTREVKKSSGDSVLVQFLGTQEKLIKQLLDGLSDNQKTGQQQAMTQQQAVAALNSLHDDMREMIKENRDSHIEQLKALVRLLERPTGGSQQSSQQ